jgi:hypothetical protein
MKVPGANHVDRQRSLLPRNYCRNPHAFGEEPQADFWVPPGGDEISLRIAVLQHRLVVRWVQGGGPSGAELGRRWQVSKQTISRTRRGERWMGELVLAALLEIRRTHPS